MLGAALLLYYIVISLTAKTIRIATPTYATKEECETITQKKCAILMCDLIPAGQTFEEACGKGFKPGWGALQ